MQWNLPHRLFMGIQRYSWISEDLGACMLSDEGRYKMLKMLILHSKDMGRKKKYCKKRNTIQHILECPASCQNISYENLEPS